MKAQHFFASAFAAGAIATGAQAAVITTSLSAPAVDGADIASLTGTSGSTFSVGKWWTDTSDPGQTFTTGISSAGYTLNAFSLYSRVALNSTYGQTIRVSTISGSTLTPVASETTGNTSVVLSAAGYMTWTFDTPVVLAANTTYAVDVRMTSASGTIGSVGYSGTTNPYSGGVRYFVNDGATSVSLRNNEDYNFHLDLVENPVPEPGSLALMGVGGLLIARRRRG